MNSAKFQDIRSIYKYQLYVYTLAIIIWKADQENYANYKNIKMNRYIWIHLIKEM